MSGLVAFSCSTCPGAFPAAAAALLQAHGVVLGPAELAVVAFTASLAAIGAPAIPSAGLVTMLIVLQAVNLGQYAAGEEGRVGTITVWSRRRAWCDV